MTRDHRHPPPVRQPPRRCAEEAVEPLELAVDPDANRLKRPRRRIDSRVPLARNRPPYDLGELPSRLDSNPLACGDDCPGDASRMTLFAELVNHVRERPLVHVAEGGGGRGTSRRVHPHVERIVLPKTEAAAWRIELHR